MCPWWDALGGAVTLGRDCFGQNRIPWGGDRAPALGTKRRVTESVLLVFFKKPSFINEDIETLRVWDLPKVTPRGGSGTRTQTSRCHGLDPVPTPQPPLSMFVQQWKRFKVLCLTFSPWRYWQRCLLILLRGPGLGLGSRWGCLGRRWESEVSASPVLVKPVLHSSKTRSFIRTRCVPVSTAPLRRVI